MAITIINKDLLPVRRDKQVLNQGATTLGGGNYTGGSDSAGLVSAITAVPTPADNQVAVWTDADTLEGTSGFTFNGSTLNVVGTITGTTITGANVTSGADPGHTHTAYEPHDDDLTAIATLGYASTSFLKKTGVNTWALDTTIYESSLSNPGVDGYVLSSTATGVRSWVSNGSMVYPDAGIALSTGSAWGTSITNNSANWNTAYGWGNHASAGYAPTASPTFTGTATAPVFAASNWFKLLGTGGSLLGYLGGFNTIFGSGPDTACMYISTGNSFAFMNGNVGIGTIAPGHPLHTVGNTSGWASRVRNSYGNGSDVYMANGGGYGMHIDPGASATSSTYALQVKSGTGEALYVRGDGNVGIGTVSPSEKLHVTGNILASGTMTATNFILSSDVKLKSNIKSLMPSQLDIEYKEFNHISDPTQLRYGVIAQDLIKVAPELVRTADDGTLSVAYIDLLIKEVAYLKYKVDELNNRLNNG